MGEVKLIWHGEDALCPICNFSWVPGLPGQARQHATFHARYMRPRRPKPEPRLAAYAGDVRIDETSPRWLHRIVYRCAVAPKRDEGYDFPQWREDGPPRASRGGRERDLHALLLVEDGIIPVGAVSFSRIDWKDSAPGWHMNFAWAADDWRRKGVMSRRWLGWRSTYGDFTLDPPLSDAMRAFVEAQKKEAVPVSSRAC
jgi:hypothetical protein